MTDRSTCSVEVTPALDPTFAPFAELRGEAALLAVGTSSHLTRLRCLVADSVADLRVASRTSRSSDAEIRPPGPTRHVIRPRTLPD